MSKPRDDRQKDLLLPALDRIIDMSHPLVQLAALIDWNILDERFSSVCQAGSGQPGLPTRLVAGLFILKHMHNLSDEVLCARWIENPNYQYFCGELSFCHRLPFDRSSITRWRQRLGEEQLVALIQESLSVAHKTGAIGPKDLEYRLSLVLHGRLRRRRLNRQALMSFNFGHFVAFRTALSPFNARIALDI